MILTPAALPGGSAGERLLRVLAERGHAVGQAAPPSAAAATLFVCPASEETAPDLRTWLAAHAHVTGRRLLLVTRLGTHPDAASPGLRESWALEEAARGAGLPVLILRTGPMLGPESPLWRRLRSAPPLPRRGRKLLNPVAEADVVETLDRALSGRAEWGGWYEAAGHEVWSLAELAELARQAGPPLPVGSGDWEPSLGELEEHRLAESEPWLEHFGMSVRPLAEQAREWGPVPARRTA